ncbi:MAG: hypothetical protein IKV62_03355 [Bacteroidales bacterium]|nr:hypothetical protein [Bacteroidales bacterium]
MKKIYGIAILCAVLLPLVSCGGDPVEPEPTPVGPEPETRTLTFVLPEFTIGEGEEAPDILKTAWKAGDQIVVHGEYAKNQVTVTLAAGDISGDGKTATVTVENLYPYKREDCTSTLYASYPAELVNNLKHCFFYSQFSSTNAQIMAACNNGDTFQFQNICGILAMTAEGGLGGYTLSTPKKDALGYEFLQVKITDNEQNYKQYVGNPVIQMDGTVNGDEILIFLPEGTSFPAGFVMKFKEGDDYTKIYKYNHPVEIARGSIVNIGDITAEIQHYDNPFSSDVKDLDASGNANCYVITEPGSYKFKAVFGNESKSFIPDVESAEILWETWNDASEVTPNSVLAAASFAEDFIILRTPDTLKPGNAMVVAKDAAGKILWSWHIWVPATKIVTANFSGVMIKDMMDRNLGALVATTATDEPIDPTSFGMMYQWGRKDPFTAAGALGSSSPATYAGVPEEVAPGQITLEESIANPRLLGHINNGDWCLISNDEYWADAEKTIYDPCPPGYRVSQKNTAAPFWSADLSAQAGWSINTAAGWLKIGTPDPAIFPIAGYRDDYEVGGLAKVGVRTLYWTSQASSEAKGPGADLRSDKGTYVFGSAPKARLGSVRCVVE